MKKILIIVAFVVNSVSSQVWDPSKNSCLDDTDLDTVYDCKDNCPFNPEDPDGFMDNDGCPDLDNDKDGIEDPKDSCPNKAENFNEYQDADGCPDETKLVHWSNITILTDEATFTMPSGKQRKLVKPHSDSIFGSFDSSDIIAVCRDTYNKKDKNNDVYFKYLDNCVKYTTTEISYTRGYKSCGTSTLKDNLLKPTSCNETARFSIE